MTMTKRDDNVIQFPIRTSPFGPVQKWGMSLPTETDDNDNQPA